MLRKLPGNLWGKLAKHLTPDAAVVSWTINHEQSRFADLSTMSLFLYCPICSMCWVSSYFSASLNTSLFRGGTLVPIIQPWRWSGLSAPSWTVTGAIESTLSLKLQPLLCESRPGGVRGLVVKRTHMAISWHGQEIFPLWQWKDVIPSQIATPCPGDYSVWMGCV